VSLASPITIMWFRQDLRLQNNPALSAAFTASNVLPIYILDDETAGQHRMGAASRWWLHHSLTKLDASLGNALNVYSGNAAMIIEDLCQRFDVEAVFWNRCYEPHNIEQTKHIKIQLSALDIKANSINGSLLNEPWSVFKKDGSPYKIFTPYHREACKVDQPTALLPAPFCHKPWWLIQKPQI